MSRDKPEAPLFTADARVLFVISGDPSASFKVIADRAGIDPRHVLRIVERLAAAGYITRKGSTSPKATYDVHTGSPVNEPLVETTVEEFLAAFRRLEE